MQRERYERAPGGATDPVGLCRSCVHAACQRSARGSEFWRCRRSEVDGSLRRYPPLPVRLCHAFENGVPREGDV